MAATYDTPIKQKARELELKFARKHIKDPAEIDFLGLVGHEALEVERVTEKLGIPCCRVTALEHDKGRYEKLCERNKCNYNSQIDVKHNKAVKYLRGTEKKMGFISLDRDGDFGKEAKEEIRLIFGRQLLKPPAILHTMYYGTRENEDVSTFYFNPEEIVDAIMGNKDIVDFYERTFFRPEGMRKQKRSYGVTLSIMRAAGLGKANIGPVELSKDLTADLSDEKSRNRLAKTMRGVKRQLGKSAEPVFYFLFGRAACPYFVTDTQRFYYATETVPMYGDLFKFEQHRDVFDWKGFADLTIRKNKVCDGTRPLRGRSKLTKTIVRLMKKIDTQRRHYPLNRLFLGSEWRKLLDEEGVLDLFEDGRSVEHVYKNYRGWSLEQLEELRADPDI